MSVTITEKAAKQIAAALKEQNAADKALRVSVQAGVCSGLEYRMTFDDQKKGDEVIQQNGVRVVIDSKSLQHLQGSVIDYVDGLQGTGFKINNPNAKESCGCGKSFG